MILFLINWITDALQIASWPTVLEESPASVSKFAIKGLQNLKIDVKLQTKVASLAQTLDHRQQLTLLSGVKLITDLYIPTFGLIPNSSYIPSKFLNGNGYVMVDEYLKVKGTKDVWAIGDVSDVEYSQFIWCDKQSAHLAKSLTLILSNKAPLPYKVTSMRKKTPCSLSGVWLIVYRYDGSLDWEERRNWPLGKYQNAKFCSSLDSEELIPGKNDADPGWLLVLIILVAIGQLSSIHRSEAMCS